MLIDYTRENSFHKKYTISERYHTNKKIVIIWFLYILFKKSRWINYEEYFIWDEIKNSAIVFINSTISRKNKLSKYHRGIFVMKKTL
jgi:hypothetical protein